MAGGIRSKNATQLAEFPEYTRDLTCHFYRFRALDARKSMQWFSTMVNWKEPHTDLRALHELLVVLQSVKDLEIIVIDDR